MNSSMDIAWHRHRTIAVLSVPEGDDRWVCQELAEGVESVIHSGAARIVLNISRVSFISSATLAYLLAGSRRVSDLHGELVLSGLSRGVARVLHHLALGEHFKTFEDVEAAVRYLSDLDSDGPGDHDSDGPGGAGHPAPLLPRRPTGPAEAARDIPPPQEA